MVTGYLLSLAAVIPLTGWAARRFGAKRVYMTSLVLFTAGSALCAVAASTTTLVLFRVLQGVGGGMIMPVGQLIMAQVAGPKRMGRVMGIVAMPAMLAPILGPVLGGLILQNLHWSWIFLVNVPIGVIAFVLGWRMLPHTDSGDAGRLDVLGLGLLSSASTAVVYGLSELGTNSSLTAPIVVWPIVAGVVLAGVFCWHALRVERPLLDVRLYGNRVFGSASLTTFGLGAALFGAMILVPLYYQEVRHESVIVDRAADRPAGARDAVRDAVRRAASPIASAEGGWRSRASRSCAWRRFRSRFSARALRSPTSRWCSCCGASGIGFSFMPAMTAAFASLRPEQLSDATPQLNVLQRIGGAIGMAVLAVVLAASERPRAHAAQAGRGLRHRVLVVAGDRAARADPAVVLLRAENPRAKLTSGAVNAEAAVEPLGV